MHFESNKLNKRVPYTLSFSQVGLVEVLLSRWVPQTSREISYTAQTGIEKEETTSKHQGCKHMQSLRF